MDAGDRAAQAGENEKTQIPLAPFYKGGMTPFLLQSKAQPPPFEKGRAGEGFLDKRKLPEKIARNH